MNDINPDYAPAVARSLFSAISGMYVSKAVWESKTTSPRLDTKDLGAKFDLFLTSQMKRNQKNSLEQIERACKCL